VGARTSVRAELEDLYRTLVDLAGLNASDIQPDVQGMSCACARARGVARVVRECAHFSPAHHPWPTPAQHNTPHCSGAPV
jgi:hypothetical protein